MPKVSLSFAESAIQDLEQILAWYEGELVPHVGRRIVADIMSGAELLIENPDMGRVVPEFGEKSLRELIQSPYRIVYKREEKRVRVVRVWRSERLLQLSEKVGASSGH